MVRLLKNDFYKIYKEKAHLILLIILAANTLMTIGLMAFINLSGEVGEALKAYTYLSAMGGNSLGMFIVLSISIYLGNDFRNRTINLKVLAGYKRTEIFFGILLMNLIVFAVFFVFTALFSFGFCYLLFGGFGSQLKDVLIKTALMLPPYLAIVSVATLISLSLKSVLGIVINLVILLVLGTVGQVFSMLSLFTGENEILKFITEVIPYFSLGNISGGGLFEGAEGASAYGLDMILKNIIGSVIFIGGAITGSFFVFKNKPLN